MQLCCAAVSSVFPQGTIGSAVNLLTLKPFKEVWKASINGRAAFAPDAVAFINVPPDNGKVTIRTTRSDGEVKEEISIF